jgi:predicted ATP-grasp superfamily ATP-dependent carboligase
MRLFICEFITGGGMQQEDLPLSLVHEGEMMLQALMRDVTDAGITEIVTTRDYRLGQIGGTCRVFNKHDDVWETWCNIMQTVDAVWPIAPETGGDLLRLTELALACDCALIGCTPDAVTLTSSKRKTFQCLSHHQLPVVDTYTLDEYIPDFDDGWILKPDDGVGGSNCRHIKERNMLEETLCTLPSKENYIIQPYIKGEPASLSLLCYRQTGVLMASNQQKFVFNGEHGRLEGLVVNGMTEQWSILEKMAMEIASAIPGLAGYVGVDFISSKDGPRIIEINPRLTTAYAGLRESLDINPVAMIFNLFETGQYPSVRIKKRLPVTIDLH